MIMQFITIAFVASVIILGWVAWIYVEQAAGDVTKSIDPNMAYLFVGIGVAMLFLAPVVARIVLKASLPNDKSGSIEVNPTKVVNLYFQSVILGHAIRESCAILGFVATFTSMNVTWSTLTSALAAIAIILAWPSKEKIKEYLPRGY